MSSLLCHLGSGGPSTELNRVGWNEDKALGFVILQVQVSEIIGYNDTALLVVLDVSEFSR